MRESKHPIIACVLRSGGEYQPNHVEYLFRQLEQVISNPYQFVCLTDMDLNYSGIITIKLKHNWPGWWSKIELFRLTGFVIAFDLDTVFFGNIDSFIKEVSQTSDFYLLESFRPPKRGISGIMAWNGDWRQFYRQFDYKKDSRRYRGDENYISAKLKGGNFPVSFVQDSLDGVYSWKRHCKGTVPKDCNILVFHGKPRPWQVPEVWNPMLKKVEV